MNRVHDRWLLITGLLLVTAALLGGFLTGPDAWTGMGGWHSSMMGAWRASAETPPIEGAAEVEVVAGEFAFSPREITVTAGRPTNLTLVNDGSVPHNLVIAEFDLHVEARPGQSSTAGFTPQEPGRYSIVCTYPGHADAGMRATLTVVEP